MNMYRSLKNQAGFTLVQAIFILVVLALLGAAMVRLIGVQSSTSVMALQQARAYQAARSGLEWGAARASTGAGCTGGMTINGFQVAVVCQVNAFTEGSIGPYNVYRISAEAVSGVYGSPDYVSRTVQMKVGFYP
ncbi:pilus assembly protein MshP [Pelobacter seleniigenes]|uniref:pilus assembly protein MshP n=1 Tax=Pelobacter seleniigenes TaxID=407188 RepID=UPI0004A73CD6|nr:pilus assembly protein MshP [Pelobacter seleniigenes]